ncbi:oligosaccharide flippase family protein [Sulfitobacter sp. JL08]|uniref:oligosaccharide flippase family protein n=1 Tax=Sulfitobacter sp. JL08 TaxID=2070369 RepID=UPI0013B3D3A6|nr:oligosaccharide flippase family protein [Sulfitobacter sp. JL08]
MAVNRSNISLGLWSIVLQWSRFAIAALVFICIANWLSLAEIGAFAVAAAPLRFLQVVHRTGITDADIVARSNLAHGKETDALFVISICVAFALAALLYFASRMVGFLSESELPVGPMMASLAIVPLFNGLAAVPEGILRHSLRVRALALRTMAVQSVSAGLTFVAASHGLGPWSLVLFLIANAVLGAVSALFIARWRPSCLPRPKHLFGPARSVLVLSGQALVSNALQPLLQLSVGYWLGLADAGAFQIAMRFLGLLDAIAVAPARYLALPLLSGSGRGNGWFERTVPRAVRLSALVSAPVYLGAACTAPLILAVFVGPDHARSSAAMFQFLCFLGLANAVSMILLQASVAAGRADVALWRSLGLLILSAVLAWPALGYSATAVAGSAAVAGMCISICMFCTVPPKIDVPVKPTARAAAWPVMAALSMGFMIHALARTPALQNLSDPLQLGLLVVVGLSIYAILIRLMAKESITDLAFVFKSQESRP